MTIKNDKIKIEYRMNLYRDFIISMCYSINKTYPGDDCMDSDDKKNHFFWVFNKIINQYENLNIVFKNHSNIRNYFKLYFFESYYNDDDKNMVNIVKFWKNLFDYDNKIKTKIDVDSLVSVYNLFDESLNFNETIGITE